jgi:hypothetical protein
VISRRFKGGQEEPERKRQDAEAGQDGNFALEETHERRILSWSPDPDEELGPEPEPAADEPPDLERALQDDAGLSAERYPPTLATPPVEAPFPQRQPPRPAARAAAAFTGEQVEAPREETPVQQRQAPAAGPASTAPPAAGTEQPRRRGRPKGRPRRQVHFHVDPDEELLLLAAAQKHGSQQKGLVAALQALQDNEILRDEIERLRTECERQRVLLAEAEAIFNR